ncbi:HNH endonuclease [Arthrobacter sp. ISL-85]|uniref:HNH endonuclease n=1 Tax=Arthrobacter sp. ISL-85 TaxID=2819115 RepID=UPI0037BE4ED3
METGLRRRCRRPAESCDHFYPWSKGGSTSLQIFVAACARCNHAKWARIPSPGLQPRIQRRRVEYLATESSVSVGEREPPPRWSSAALTGAKVFGGAEKLPDETGRSLNQCRNGLRPRFDDDVRGKDWHA